MITADNIFVDDDEGRFILKVYTEDGDNLTIDIHDDVLAFYKQVVRDIGPYASDAACAQREVALGIPLPVTSRPVSVEDAIDAGYALDDPKSPGFHDRMVD